MEIIDDERAVTVADFLYHEAALADAHAYDDWLSLWEPDALYFVPCNDDDADPASHVALIYNQYRELEDRINRLKSGHIHAQRPRSRLCRVVSNIRVAPNETGLVEVHSVCNLTAYRRGVIDQLAGRVVHVLRPKADTYRMVKKTVYLINNDSVMGNLSFLL